MTIMITGAGGFVGHALVDKLVALGRSVVALDTRTDMLVPHPNLRMVQGDLASAAVRAEALRDGVASIVHLATVPGGAAEANPAASRRINIDAMYDLLLEASARSACPKVIYASSIAVFGDPLPPSGVDDLTPLAPKLVYAGHKAMMEVAVALMTNRGEIDGVTLRLPGMLARPKGPSGMKSAFMSDLFHALLAGAPFVCPVSPRATIWAQSVTRGVENLLHALSLESEKLPISRAVTLPALHVMMTDLVDEIARQCGVSGELVSYQPNPSLEAAFGAHPSLSTPAAERAGFRHDGSLSTLVGNALAHIAGE